MSSIQQLEQNKNKTRFQIQVKAHWESFVCFWILHYIGIETQKNMQNFQKFHVGYFLCLIYYWIFIELCLIIQQKRWRPDVSKYFQRRINDKFYRPTKTVFCIWQDKSKIFQTQASRHNLKTKEASRHNLKTKEASRHSLKTKEASRHNLKTKEASRHNLKAKAQDARLRIKFKDQTSCLTLYLANYEIKRRKIYLWWF